MKVARLTLSDRASAGIYQDLSGPEIERVLGESGLAVDEWVRRVMPDDRGDPRGAEAFEGVDGSLLAGDLRLLGMNLRLLGTDLRLLGTDLRLLGMDLRLLGMI